MRDGETVATRRREEVDKATLISMMVGRAIDTVYPKHESAPGDVALELRHVSNRATGLKDISLSVRCGEIVGLAGLVGSGRTPLAESRFGLTPANEGAILLGGGAVQIGPPAQALQLGNRNVSESRRPPQRWL